MLSLLKKSLLYLFNFFLHLRPKLFHCIGAVSYTWFSTPYTILESTSMYCNEYKPVESGPLSSH